MSAEKPSRFEVIQSALAHSREIVAAGPTEEIPIFTIEGLADTSIPLLEQLEIHEEHVINPDGESAPHIDKINTPFRRELYHQLYSSAQRGILPTRDALVFALFIDELNNGMDRREAVALTNDNIKSLTGTLGKNGVEVVSKAGHKGVYYNLPKFYKEPAEITTEAEKPQMSELFPEIPNEEISSYISLFQEGTATRAYIQYAADLIAKGIYPNADTTRKHFFENGYTLKNHENSVAYLRFRFRQIALDRRQKEPSVDETNQTSKSTSPGIEGFFKGIPNADLPDPDDVFRPNTLSHKYFTFVRNQIKDGVLPTLHDVKSYLSESGASIEHFEQIRTSVEKKVRESLGPSFDAWKSKREIVNGFPVIIAPERPHSEEQVQKQSADDEMQRVSIQFMRPDLKVVASTVFDRTAGKSISQSDWIAEIRKENPNIFIGPTDLPRLIQEMREEGNIKVISFVSDGVTYYYRRSDNIKRI